VRAVSIADLLGRRTTYDPRHPLVGPTLFGPKNALQVAQQQRAFTPFVPDKSPAPGFYDTALDAAGRAAQRGFDYHVGDLEDAGARSKEQYGWQVQGLERTRDRGLADLLREKTREGQDYSQHTADLGQSYQRLGTQQVGNAEQAGVAGGGTLAAALRARTANQGHDQGLLDQSHARFGENYAKAVSRIGEDYGADPLGALGAAGVQYGYGVDDRGKDLQQSGIENVNYQSDINDQRWQQAGQMGYQAPERPANEFGQGADAYRIVVRGNRRYRVDPTGKEKFVGTRPKGK
jgi:hypothetical protein